MSRIGKKPVPIPPGAKVTAGAGTLRVEGPKGKLEVPLFEPLAATIEGGVVRLENRQPEDRHARAGHGLSRALLANALRGVTSGYERRLEVVGVGWNAKMQGKDLALTLGFAHPVVIRVGEGLSVECPQPTQIVVRGADAQAVGALAAKVRSVRPPEPYNGKGIKYDGETIRRKAGKAFAAGTAGGGGG
ncbi:MAG TPA: 50S ribosomal protein L6 [Planctomycetota bacterium]|jgi:large subunit ribosomal protein L6|nr:50S ribosomal protein L6 [Planctomycetota bacterium]